MPLRSSRYQPATKAQFTLPSDFHHQLKFHQHGSGTVRDTLTRVGQLIIQARTSVLAPRTYTNLRLVISVSNSFANSRKEIHNDRARVSKTTFHIYASAALSLTTPWVEGRPRTLREFPTSSPGTSRSRISRTVAPNEVIFSFVGKLFSLAF